MSKPFYQQRKDSEIQRRLFLKWMGLSTLSLTIPFQGCNPVEGQAENSPTISNIKNIFDLERTSGKVMGDDALLYLNGGADDLQTVRANVEAFQKIQIRARRLVDVTNVSTSTTLFGELLDNPIILSPVGFQQFIHPEGEVAAAKAAAKKKHQMFVSSASNYSVNEIAEQTEANLWFQLYPTTDRTITKLLLQRAEQAGCKVVALTVDTPVLGNRERSGTTLAKLLSAKELRMGNFEGLPEAEVLFDGSMTWDIIDWLKDNSNMKVVLKGIVTREDAALAVERGADGIIISNHGGRQLESNRATIDCLVEVVDQVDGKLPVLIDGGIRRGTDIFKALALGADAVCVGRAFCWGLGAYGQEGVELALEILKAELIRDMQLAGVTSIDGITENYIKIT